MGPPPPPAGHNIDRCINGWLIWRLDHKFLWPVITLFKMILINKEFYLALIKKRVISPMVLLSLYSLLSDLVKVAPAQRKLKLWRPKKPETVELTSNGHAIIHLDSIGNQRNVIGILPLRGDSQIRGHFFSSDCGEKLNNLRALLAKCCDGKVFCFETLMMLVISLNLFISR